jgi:predicted secreted protein
MSTYIGNSGVVKSGSNAVAEVLSFSVSESANVADDTVLGDTWKTHIVGTFSWKATVNCYYMEGDTTGQDTFGVGDSVTVHLIPRGAGTGHIDLTGTATITGVETATSLDGIVTANFTLEGSGALSRSALA